MDLEVVVASNHAELQDMLDNVQRQLQDIQNVMVPVASNAELEPIERIRTIELSVLALHDVMKKSVEHQKASNVLYQKLSDEVADTRATTNDLVTLQESINRLPDSCLQPIQDTMAGTTLLSELQTGSENSARHADSVTGHCLVDNEPAAGTVDSVLLRSSRFKFTTEPIISLLGHILDSMSCCMISPQMVCTILMLGGIIVAMIFRNVVDQESSSGIEERLMWQFCKDAWGTMDNV
ncbi:hypothetical protein CY34DRAFT_111307 [Suillus luteus UH-Slu-Lm8-n1]|uniref:Uncharacterized protein n=1 Tax=Suillus luteus UH-Slu-Lm8-n1 TaxID=930992 RepID=A0A0C9Z2C7_9AGAM|nr:hypothetical protein CY34DRAFT_111307 [Suillus luteus UH-Slu-Lm8-n1]